MNEPKKPKKATPEVPSETNPGSILPKCKGGLID